MSSTIVGGLSTIEVNGSTQVRNSGDNKVMFTQQNQVKIEKIQNQPAKFKVIYLITRLPNQTF